VRKVYCWVIDDRSALKPLNDAIVYISAGCIIIIIISSSSRVARLVAEVDEMPVLGSARCTPTMPTIGELLDFVVCRRPMCGSRYSPENGCTET